MFGIETAIVTARIAAGDYENATPKRKAEMNAQSVPVTLPPPEPKDDRPLLFILLLALLGK
jgi:hypothetical protein